MMRTLSELNKTPAVGEAYWFRHPVEDVWRLGEVAWVYEDGSCVIEWVERHTSLVSLDNIMFMEDSNGT